MGIHILQQYLPDNTLAFLKKWFADYPIHIKITKDRSSKLGDYRKMPDGSHQISINSTLQKQLFFFVLTHELAHLLAFEKYSHRINAHGKEWKALFSQMLVESIEVYTEDLRPIILKFSKNPKANFMASPDFVRYFYPEAKGEDELYIENLDLHDYFQYNGQDYQLIEKKKKLYLCVNLKTSKKYLFRPLARGQKIKQ